VAWYALRSRGVLGRAVRLRFSEIAGDDPRDYSPPRIGRQTVGTLRRLAALIVDQCRAEVVSELRGAGFDGICLCTPGDAEVTDVTAYLESACKTAVDQNLPVVALSLSPADRALTSSEVDVRQAGIERLGAVIEAAGARGLAAVVLAPPVVTSGDPTVPLIAYGDAVNAMYFAAHQLAATAEMAGVTLCVRAPSGGCLLSPVEVRELVDAATSSSVGVCVDAEDLQPIGRLDDWIQTLHRRVHALWGVTVDQAQPFVPALTRSPASDLWVIERRRD